MQGFLVEKLAALIVTVLMVVTLVGCGQQAASAPAKPADSKPAESKVADAKPAAKKELEKVKINYPAPTVSVLTVSIAKDKGYFAEEGIEAEMMMTDASISVKALIAGEFDFSTSVGGSFAARLQKGPVRIVYVGTDRNLFWLYGQADIKASKDLKGKVVGIPAPGSTMEVFVRSYLNDKVKLDPAKDYTLIFPGASPQILAAMKGGSVHAGTMTPPHNLTAKAAGYNMLVNFAEETPVVSGGLATTEKVLSSKPDMVKRAIKASLKGGRYFKSNKEGSIPLMAKFLQISEDQARSIYDDIVKYYTDDGMTKDADAKVMIDWQAKSLGLTDQFKVEDVFDYTQLKPALQELNASGWKP